LRVGLSSLRESPMSQSTSRRRRQACCKIDRELIHWLNQRYKAEWDRAEGLQAELDHIKASRSWRILNWWRRLIPWRRAEVGCAGHTLDSVHSTACEILNDHFVAPAGTVSVLIPFKDRLELLRHCLRSLRRSTYRPREIILIDNGSTSPRMRRYLARLQSRGADIPVCQARTNACPTRVISCLGPFNFSRLCNPGARHATGDYLLFLNNDVEVLTPDWLQRMLELAGHTAIGIVGATLLYPDGTLQHAGIFPRSDGQWLHAHRGLPQSCVGDSGELLKARAIPAVTGACLMIRRDLFTDLGGFAEEYPVTFNDVDLCCRVRQRGLKVAITPHARLWHFESLSRGYAVEPRLPKS